MLRLVPVRSTDDPSWAEVMAFYRTSFPPAEQRSDAEYAKALADPAFRADAIRRDDTTVGLLFYWLYDDTCYIEHFAVSPALRGQRIGSRVLSDFCRGQRVILEIDPPETDIAIRRQHFYERAGFVTNPHRYVHPSYGCPEQAHRLTLMSYPAPLTNDEARGFADFVREKALRYSDLRHPVTQPKLP